MLALNIVGFAFVCLHAVTWFNLAPQAMVVRVAGRRVPGWMIAVSNYAALATTAVIVACCWVVTMEDHDDRSSRSSGCCSVPAA